MKLLKIVCFTTVLFAVACNAESDESGIEEEEAFDSRAAGDGEPEAASYFAGNEIDEGMDDVDDVSIEWEVMEDMERLPADSESPFEIAVADDAAFLSDDDEERARAFQKAHDLHATVIRTWVYWGQVMAPAEPPGSPPDLRQCKAEDITRPDGTVDRKRCGLDQLDIFVDEAIAHGFKVELTLTGTASNCEDGRNSDRRLGCVLNDDSENCGRGCMIAGKRSLTYKEFGGFVYTMVAHFFPRVSRFSIWNEPNHHVFLYAKEGDRRAEPGTYVELYRVGRKKAYEAYNNEQKARELACRKAGQSCKPLPKLQVFFGELLSAGTRGKDYPLRFMELVEKRILKEDKGKQKRRYHVRAEGFALHPYQHYVEPRAPDMDPDRAPAGIGSLEAVQRMLATMGEKRTLRTRNGDPVPLFLTEFGYFRTTPACGECLALNGAPCRDSERTEWTDEAFSIAREINARQMLYYMLFSPDPCPNQLEYWDTSLFPSDGDRPPLGDTPLCPSGWHPHHVDWAMVDLYDSPCETILEPQVPRGTVVCMRSVPAEVECGQGWSLVYRPEVDGNMRYWARTEAFDGH